MEYNKNIDERTKKILQTIIKHCNIILETKIYFGDEYEKFENNKIYQNAVLTPVTQIGELVKKFLWILEINTMKFHGRI